MKKFRIGKRLLAGVLALIMIVSIIPLNVLAGIGDLDTGKTGLDTDINTLDTISWPIKVYDYLNDGMLFEYASASHTSISDLDGDAYGGGEVMPSELHGSGMFLGNDYTVNSSETDIYDRYAYSHWLKSQSGYAAAVAQQGVNTKGAFKFLRLQPYKDYKKQYNSYVPGLVVSDFKYDSTIYSGQNTSYAKDQVRYAVLIYRTNVSDLKVTMGVSDTKGSKTVLNYNLATTNDPNGDTVKYDQTKTVTLTKDTATWKSVIVDMNSGTAGARWNNGTAVTQIIMDTNMATQDQYMDLSHIAYFSTELEALRFAERAVAFSNNPGEYLPDQTYTVNGTTYTKHWNMGNNNAFTMLYASSGGGWNGTGGSNSWDNGYFSYQLGKHTGTTTTATNVNSIRQTAKNAGYPVPDDIFHYSIGSNKSHDLSQYDFGYTLFNTITTEDFASVMTAGLLQNALTSIVGVDGKTYRIPQYKSTAVEYMAVLLANTLSIGQKDQYGNYNYNFVKGSVSSQFADANGNKRDLASALREALGMKAAKNNKGNYTLNENAAKGSYAQSKARQELLVGPYQQVIAAFKAKGLTFTYFDAAYYLMHNLFVDNSYNQLQDDYNYLLLSKATVSSTGKEAYVFDAGFTTGNCTDDSKSSVVYNDNNGTISLSSAVGKDQIYYSSRQKTTRYPFLPVQHPEGDYKVDGYYNSNGTVYFVDDGALGVTDYGETYAGRDYNYVLQANAEFVYHYQDDLFFEFQGDDDVYLFVNGELVLDIGAAHAITSVNFNMNKYVLQAQKELSVLKQNYGYRPSVSDEKFEEILDAAVAGGAIKETEKASYRRWHHLNLVDGKRYSIDFYYMERHGWGANMRVATNILMTDPTMITDKKAYQDGAEIKYGGIVDGSKRIEYGFCLTNEGNNKLYNLAFNDYDIGVSLTAEKGLSFMGEGINGVTVCDARGQKLDASDLVVWVDGYEDEEKTKPISLRIWFDGQDPNGELKQFLRDLSSNDGTDDHISDELYAGNGLWRHATVTIRGIYYKMTSQQIQDGQFNNTIFTTAHPSMDSDLVLNSADIHQVRLLGDARHIYQWREHDVYFTRDDLVQWLGGSVTLNSRRYTASQIKITTCRKDGTTFDFPDIIVRNNNQAMTVNYWDEGSQLFFIKIFRDTNNDGTPDDLNGDSILDKNDYLIVPLAVFVTDVKDDVIVLDYGLKAELTGKGGIVENDYVVVPNLATGYSIMGMSLTQPSYLGDISSLTKKNYNRISFAAVNGRKLEFSGGTYEYTVDSNDDQLYFTPTDFMEDEYSLYIAVTVHELDQNPSNVGVANGTTVNYSVDITKEVQMYQKVTVLPASVMYYEDDFAGLIYESELETVRSGTGSKVLQQGVDQKVNFGADQVYQTKDNAQFSGNSMKAIRVTKYGKVASFTFKGTGFEIISRTNAYDSASFAVAVKKDGTVIKLLPVITEFSNAGSAVCKHTNHNANGHCTVCSTYVGHIYYQGKCSKCGQERLDYYLVGYINEADYGCNDDHENMGQYKFVNGKLTATFKTDGYVMVKTTGNTSYFMTDGYPGANVTSAYLYNTNTPELKPDKLHIPGGVELTFTLVENADGTLTLSYTTSDDDVTDFDKKVYFNNTEDWDQVYAYYWSNADAMMVDWPGVLMSQTDEPSIYVMALPSDAEYVIFTDGGTEQTMDLTVPANNMIYNFSGFNRGWSVYNPGKTTLNFDNTASNWDRVYVHYWSKEDKQMIEWPGVEMTLIADNIHSCAIPSNVTNVLFHNGDGTQTADLDVLKNGDIYIYGTGWASQDGGDTVRTIYFKNTANWSNLHVYYWEEGSEGNLVAWPGDAMTQMDGNIYKVSIPASATHVVFNNGTDTTKTLNLRLQDDSNMFVYDQTMADTVPVGSWSVYGTLELPEEPEVTTDRTVYLINTGNWSVPYAHYWVNGGESTTWPGVKMTHVEGNLYSVKVSQDTNWIIFNNNSGTQTANLPLIEGLDTYNYQTETWSSKQTKTIYLDNNTGWTNPFAYFWFGDGSQKLSVWPGVKMTKVQGNRYSVTIPAIATKIIFNNGSGTQTADLIISAGNDLFNLSTNTWSSTGIQEEEPITSRSVYYDNNRGWEKVYAYYWALGNESMTVWPGVEMIPDENGIYGIQIPSDARYIIFTDNAGNQTADLTLPTNANFYSVPLEGCGTWEEYEAQRVLYFDAGSSGWSQVNAYYWAANGNLVSWPGEPMVKVEGTLYSTTVPYSAEKVIFNNGSGSQTADLTITDAYDKYSYNTGAWSRTSRVIYFEGKQGGSVRITYKGEETAEAKKIMTRIKNNIYRCEIPMESKYVTFEDGTIVTGPVILSDDHDFYTNNGWSIFDPAADYRSVIYFKNTQGWENVYVHYWGETVNATTWPGVPMTFVDDRFYMVNIPKGVEKVVFNNGGFSGVLRQTADLVLPDDNDLFDMAVTGNNGTWSKYTKSQSDAIHQVPVMRVDGLEWGEYEVEIQGMPTYTEDVDWSHMEDFVKTTYLYIDGLRIYQPLGSTNENYMASENGATVQELRNLILNGHAAVAAYDHGTTAYTGNVSWTENRYGTGGDMETVYMGNQLSNIDDYLLLGPNNETYLNGNAQTQAVIFYVKETEGNNHALQIAARGLDAGLFLGNNSAGVNATLYHGVFIENPNGTIGYGWRPMDTILSSTEQYYTVKYQDCPYFFDESGAKIYQIALFVRSGMVSFTNVKFVGLDLESTPVGDATELQMYNGIIFVEDEENGVIGGTLNGQNKIANKLFGISIQMDATQWIEDEKKPDIALKYPALSFEDEIYYHVFFTMPELTEQPVEMGLLMFDTLEENGTIYDASAIISGVTQINGMYVARSLGVQAKDLGKTLYFRVFAQLENGNYIYSRAASYSVRQYAKSILEGNYSAETKSLIAAMLKYGEAARNHFGGVWTLSDLITEDVSALAADYRTDLLDTVTKPVASKAGCFAATGNGFTKMAPAVSFDGAFSINYFFTPSMAVDGDMTLYYWNAEDYESADELTALNATGSMVMTPGERYTAAITGIAAKNLDSTYYVAVVYRSNGQTYCSGVLAYSLATYCKSKAAADGTISDLAKATAVYGYHAKQLFG